MARIFSYINCTLPEPDSLLSIWQAKEEAEKAGIRVDLISKKSKMLGMLSAEFAAQIVREDPGYTHMLMVSEDVIVPPNFITKLVNEDKDIIGGIYFIRNVMKTVACYPVERERLREYIDNGTVAEVLFTGAHSMLIKREVLLGMVKAYPEFACPNDDPPRHLVFMPQIIDGRFMVDDGAFCHRAVAAGYKVWTDFSIRLIHRNEDWSQVDPESKMSCCSIMDKKM